MGGNGKSDTKVDVCTKRGRERCEVDVCVEERICVYEDERLV